jgi:hypothetical protein
VAKLGPNLIMFKIKTGIVANLALARDQGKGVERLWAYK